MFCKFLNHPLLSSIQYKMFFHLCRLDVGLISLFANFKFSQSHSIYKNVLDLLLCCQIVFKAEQ